jgi:hypothetical protein
MSYLNLAIPYSASVVNVMALIGGQGAVPAGFFFEPVVAGYETINFPVYSFLIEHPAPSALDRIMFDLGVRANVSNFSPVVLEELKTGNVSWRSDKDVPTQLQEGGIDLNSISAVVWR